MYGGPLTIRRTIPTTCSYHLLLGRTHQTTLWTARTLGTHLRTLGAETRTLGAKHRTLGIRQSSKTLILMKNLTFFIPKSFKSLKLYLKPGIVVEKSKNDRHQKRKSSKKRDMQLLDIIRFDMQLCATRAFKASLHFVASCLCYNFLQLDPYIRD